MMPRKWKVFSAMAAAVVVVGLAGFGTWEYHEQPQFCATCHIMKPYLESWESSATLAGKHRDKQVACLDCHQVPLTESATEVVVYVTGRYKEPLEERKFSKEFCFSCHVPGSTHPDYASVIKLTSDLKEKGLRLNPHDVPQDASHKGMQELDCGVCHKSHKEVSKDYCGTCHGATLKKAEWTTKQ